MKHDRRPQIRISAVDGSPGRFLATFHAPFLDATYALSFGESLTGAVALHRFACMIESQYGGKVEIRIDDFQSSAEITSIADMLARIRSQEPALT
jgi:hypothetical protein